MRPPPLGPYNKTSSFSNGKGRTDEHITGAGLEGVIAGESEICYIDGYAGILSYRGYNIHTLADHATFEEVIYLLWNGTLPKQAELEPAENRPGRQSRHPAADHRFSGSGSAMPSPMDVLRTAVSMLSLYDPLAQDMSTEANQRKANKLMAQTPTIVTTFDRLRNGKPVVADDPNLGFSANFLYTLTGKRPDDVMEHTFDVASLCMPIMSSTLPPSPRASPPPRFRYLFVRHLRDRRPQRSAARRRQ